MQRHFIWCTFPSIYPCIFPCVSFIIPCYIYFMPKWKYHLLYPFSGTWNVTSNNLLVLYHVIFCIKNINSVLGEFIALNLHDKYCNCSLKFITLKLATWRKGIIKKLGYILTMHNSSIVFDNNFSIDKHTNTL